MQKIETNALKNVLDYLPERIRQAIEEYSQQNQLSPELVIELAIAQFLDVDSVTFDDCQIDSPGVLREQNKILKIQLEAAHKQS
jgi:stage III sporulation protein SpoIIIAA